MVFIHSMDVIALRGRPLAIIIVIVMTVSSLCSPIHDESSFPNSPGGPIRSTGETEHPDSPPLSTVDLGGVGNFFTENLGQVLDPNCRFFALGHPLTAYFTNEGLYLRHADEEGSITTLTISIQGSTGSGPVAGIEATHRSTYLYGDDPGQWVKDVRSYHRLTYPSIYPGIDLVFRFDDERLKYDVVVGPGADLTMFRLSYRGHRSLSIDEGTGDLMVHMEGWTLVDQAPHAFQDANGTRTEVRCGYRLDGSDVVTFLPGDHDTSLPLLIDPGIEFSTLLGTSSTDYPADLHITDDGNLFIVGTTFSPNFPTSNDAYDDEFNDLADIIVCKFDSEGSDLLYSTYIGGDSTDTPFDFEVSSLGAVHVVGETLSEDFPVTDKAYDTSHNGYFDAFALRLNATMDSLDLGTYLGAKEYDSANSVEVGPTGEMYILGWTYGDNFPVTNGAYDTTPNGDSDVFITRLDPSGVHLAFSTRLGGIYWDRAMDMEFVFPDKLYITGATGSRDFPTLPGAYNRSTPESPVGGGAFIYVCCLKTDGSRMYHSTTIGPGGFENIGQNIKVDPDGNIVIAATSGSYRYPTTKGAYIPRYNETMSGYTGVISKLDSGLTKLLASTYLGGNMNDFVVALAIDETGNNYVTGWTYSDDFPNTTKALDRTYGGWGDAFLAKMDANLESLYYSTFIGGGQQERGILIGLDPWGRVVVSGWTESSEFETTEGAYDRTHGGNRDVFLLGFWTEDEVGTVLRPLGNSRLFAGYKHYMFTVRGNPFHSDDPPDRVQLFLDARGVNVSVSWDPSRTGNPFQVDIDPDHVVHLGSDRSDVIINATRRTSLLHFRVMFNWTWPHEDTCDIMVRMSGGDPSVPDVSVLDVFSVENDLQMVHDMKARGEWQGPLSAHDWVRAGELVEVWGPIVTYENASSVYPPDNICDIVLKDDGGNSTSMRLNSGRTIEMAIHVDDETDLTDTLSLDLQDLPGEAEFVNQRAFSIRIDGDAPIFMNVIPDPDDWHSQREVLMSVTADDRPTSGIVPSSLEYSISKRGPDGYGDWTQEGLELHRNGTTIEAMLSLDFPNGEDNLVKWRIRDLVGNEGTTGDLRIRVDTFNVTFTDPIPGEHAWQCVLDVECGVTIMDIEGSGIDVSSIQYRYSHRNLSQYSEWLDWDEGSATDVETITTRMMVEFALSTLNYIQWRAMDIAGNGYTISPHYRVLVDVTPIEFYEFEPWGSGLLFNYSNVETLVWVRDDPTGSGVDLSSIEYRYTVDERTFSEWVPTGMIGIFQDTHFSYVITLPDGMHNRVQFRGKDVAGNGPTLSPEYRLRVDATGPEFQLISPDPDEKQPGPSVNITIELWDHVSTLNQDTVRYRFQNVGSERFTSWLPLEVGPVADRFTATLSLNLTPGHYNVVEFKALDLAGNTGTLRTTVWVNSAPVAVLEAPIDGGLYNGTLPIAISANGTSDLDGDVLEFSWFVDGDEDPSASGLHSNVTLYAGEHELTLVVIDDMGATDLVAITISVFGPPEPPEPPPPESPSRQSIIDDLWLVLLVLALVIGASTVYVFRDRLTGH